MKIKDVRPRILPSVRRTFAERFHIKMMKSYIILQFRENGSVAQCANYENLLLRVFSLQKFRENICINANSKGTLFSRNFSK